MSFRKNWIVSNTNACESLLPFCGNNRVLAALLNNRGINTPEKIKKFLNPLSVKLLSVYVFRDAEKAIERIKRAIENKEHITIYGDFDADGITASAVMYLALKELGAEADYYLPSREADNRGLSTKSLVRIISKRKSKLIITVDCGISDVQGVKFAQSLGADVIITDHHEAPVVLPDAYAVLNPKAPDNIDPSLDIEDIQSLNYLAGAGVSLKLAYGLLETFNRTDFANKLLPAAAVGTIGDVVELLGENRTIASAGLELIRSGAHKGINKLLETAGIKNIENVTSETIAFAIAPRLNAAGRLETAETAIKLLISEDDAVLEETALKLNQLNEARQTLCAETFETADEMYAKDKYRAKHGIILFSPDWHAGIIGITASKLIEKYNKPVFLMTSDKNNPDIIRCSCRSIKGIDIHAVISENKEYLEGFGGHKMAAGFSFDQKKISFENLKLKLLETTDRFSEGIDFNTISITADAELEPDDITEETINLTDKLQPFGSANPAPLFVMKNAVMLDFKMMGQNAAHLKFTAAKNGSKILECIKWNEPDFNLPSGAKLDLLFSLRRSTFNNITSIQLMIDDIHSELLDQKEKADRISFIDHRKKKDILDRVIDYVLTSKKTSGVYIENPVLIKNLKLPETLSGKIFSLDNIPENLQQVMFFDAPPSFDDFSKIINTAKPNIVHLMNFGLEEISVDRFISKLSGMLKYALSNLNGIFNIKRAAKALCVPDDTIECALELFEETGMIDLNRTDDDNYAISYLHPASLSEVKSNAVFGDLENRLNDINTFRNFYLNAPAEKIKETAVC